MSAYNVEPLAVHARRSGWYGDAIGSTRVRRPFAVSIACTDCPAQFHGLLDILELRGFGLDHETGCPWGLITAGRGLEVRIDPEGPR